VLRRARSGAIPHFYTTQISAHVDVKTCHSSFGISRPHPARCTLHCTRHLDPAREEIQTGKKEVV
jgi:hypothetical protein